MPRTIRVLADRSKDSGEGGFFASRPQLVPGRPEIAFACTDNRLPLQAEVLRDTDVLTICGQSLKPYSPEELDLIEGFVNDGGGLLLAADVARFELEAGLGPDAMIQNQVASRFGGQFLSADCPGARTRGSLEVCPPYSEAVARPHPAAGGREAEIIGSLAAFGPIVPPAGSRPFISLKSAGLPVAAAGRHGRGRLVMVGANAFAAEMSSHFACAALTEWLSGGRGSKRPVTLPALLSEPDKLEVGDPLRLVAEASVADKLPETMQLAQRVVAALRGLFGDDFKPASSLWLTDTLAPPRGDGGWGGRIGMQAPPGAMARHLADALCRSRDNWYQTCRLLSSVFTSRAWEIELIVRVLSGLGFAQEADRVRARADRWISEMDRRATTFDLARNYTATHEDAPRGLVVFREFLDDHGEATLAKFRAAVTAKEAFKHLPESYVWQSDLAIHGLSLAAGSDLFPWFAARGLSVHPLPITQPDARNRKARVLKRLGEAVRDENEELSSRLEAAQDLVKLGQERDWLPPGRKQGDAWTRLCAALKLAKAGDSRAPSRLKALLGAAQPAPVRALAALSLADLGDPSVADELVTLARSFEPRFQMAAGYALEKAGSARADELSLLRVTDAQSRRVGKLEVIHDGHVLACHGLVEGYRVNNVICHPWVARFTAEGVVSEHYVAWVHASPQWRRRGLARTTLAGAMDHPAARQCACSALGTGTRNVAHRLYRDDGFTDMTCWEIRQCELPGAGPAQLPTGVVLREVQPDDRAALATLLRETLGQSLREDDATAVHFPPTATAYAAWRDGKPLGLCAADYTGGDEAMLWHLALAQDDQQAAVADALLAMVHQRLRAAGAKRATYHRAIEPEPLQAALQRAGYTSRLSGGVWMMQVRHLPQLLAELAPLLERRLAKSDFKGWEGTVDLVGERLQARLTVARGRVTAGKPTATPAAVALTCDDDTATRVALGRETPFEAHLQARLEIAPRLGNEIVSLLETLFPRVPIT